MRGVEMTDLIGTTYANSEDQSNYSEEVKIKLLS